MCGVVGFVNSGKRKDDRISGLRRGIRAIAHRGPDEVGIYDDDEFSLGTVRLSVIDPLFGKQPMVTAGERFVLGFNGEIFNYLELRHELEAQGITFATRSDSEVLLYSLAVWGEQALDRLNGQFGFAFYDRKRRELLLGRDPFGERPLFYTEQGSVFYFASEIKGLFAFPEVRRELSAEGIRTNGRYWTPMPGESCFAGVRSLPPGHVVRVSPGGVTLAPYFETPIDRATPPGRPSRSTKRKRNCATGLTNRSGSGCAGTTRSALSSAEGWIRASSPRSSGRTRPASCPRSPSPCRAPGPTNRLTRRSSQPSWAQGTRRSW
jgi:asparagine synthase (glutamine-hydrolysing)